MRGAKAILLALLFIIVLLGGGFALFTGYVAYSGLRPWAEAFEGPPRTPEPHDAARLGALFDTALAWAMRVCGAVLAVVAAGAGLGHAAARGRAESLLGCLVALLAGALLVTQHWGAAAAVAALAAAVVALRFARPAPAGERGEP
jgi:hypothetical protein